MKKYSRIFKYLGNYKGQILLYFLFIILSVVFSIVSLGMLAPFFDLIFKQDGSGVQNQQENPLIHSLKELVIQQRDSTGIFSGVLGILGLICIIIIISVLLKNLFLYLSYYVLNPLKNKVVNTLRLDLYNKILHLPIGYFTGAKKGRSDQPYYQRCK
jgi:subfamily B ATP-binding cassette protein MsbA